MRKNNGQVSRGRPAMDYAATATKQMKLYCNAHQGSPSATHRPRLFSAASFGSHCWGQAWKKAFLGSDLLSRQPCVRSMRNTMLGSVHRLSVSVGSARCAGRAPQRCVPTGILRPIENLAQKFQILRGRRSGLFEPFEQLWSSIPIERCERELPNDLPQPRQIVMRTTPTGKHL